jgi:hypothetical protein
MAAAAVKNCRLYGNLPAVLPEPDWQERWRYPQRPCLSFLFSFVPEYQRDCGDAEGFIHHETESNRSSAFSFWLARCGG